MVKELVTYFGLILFSFCALVCSINQLTGFYAGHFRTANHLHELFECSFPP